MGSAQRTQLSGGTGFSRLAIFSRLSPGEYLALGFMVLVLLGAFIPGILTGYDPYGVSPGEAFQGPSLSHLFGTDESGRDVFTRVVYGAGPSLTIGITATLLGMVLATGLAFGASFGPRWVQWLFGRTIESLLALPMLMFALMLLGIFGGGTTTSTVAVAIGVAPGYARIIQSVLVQVRIADYVRYAATQGYGRLYRLRVHILPNTLSAVLVIVTLGFGQAIVWAASLSYLGLGTPPPTAEWGAMINAGRLYMTSAWWLTVFPGLVITLVALASTVLGRGIRHRQRYGL